MYYLLHQLQKKIKGKFVLTELNSSWRTLATIGSKQLYPAKMWFYNYKFQKPDVGKLRQLYNRTLEQILQNNSTFGVN